METEKLRGLLLEYLKAFAKPRPGVQTQLQFGTCLNGVKALVAKNCPDDLDPSGDLREEDGSRLKHVVWDLVIERVLIPGTENPRGSNDGWPFLSLTDHGKKVVAEQHTVPYDPDGYLARLRDSTGALHQTIEAYLAESLGTFRTGNNLASAVMLGAASEMLFTLLCRAIANGFANPADQSSFAAKTDEKKSLVKRIDAVENWLAEKKSQLPSEWQGQEQRQLIRKIADFIRHRRNETGHPQDPPMKPSHEEMYALLMIFPDYYVKLSALLNWLDSKNATIT